jgi:Arc/MetJ family transcription regulator
MRTNIVIDDKLMDEVMAMGGYKTKREAVEEGLRMIKRRKAYDALLAARGTLHWDDSDDAWAQRRAEQAALAAGATEPAAHEPAVPYTVATPSAPAPVLPVAKRTRKATTK